MNAAVLFAATHYYCIPILMVVKVKSTERTKVEFRMTSLVINIELLSVVCRCQYEHVEVDCE